MAFVQTDADLRSLIAGARDIIYACDAAGHFTFANPFAVELMGYPEHEILGRHFLTLVRDDHKEAATKFYGRQFVGRVVDTYFEFPAVLKSGDGVWLGQHVQLIIENDRITGFQSIARDITRQKNAEFQLRSSEEAYRSLVQNASVGIFRSTIDGRILDSNPAFATMLGYDSPADVVALQDIAGLYANQADRAPVKEALIGAGQITDLAVHWKRRDGSPLMARMSARAVHGANGAITAVEVIAEDVTERLRLEQQRRQAQTLDAVGQLATGIAHHFNNLLTGMLGFTELLSSQAGVSAEMKADLGQILKAGRRATELTRQLKAFSEPRTPKVERLDLNEVLRRIHDTMARMMRDNMTLDVQLAPDPAPIQIDPGDLEQVIMQVVRNARDATPSGGAVKIDVSRVSNPNAELYGDFIRLRIADTGVGMNWETQARMFEPFFTTKPQDEGTGLGLSVAYGIVRTIGGAIDVDSEINRGTTVTIYFPASQ